MQRKISGASVRAQGPIPALARNVGFRTDAHWMGGRIDLAPFRGTPIPVTRRCAETLLDARRNKITMLVAEGALQLAPPSAERPGSYVLVDPSWSPRDVFETFVANMPEPHGHGDFDRYERVRDLCGVSASELPPAKVLEGLFGRLLEIGCFGRREAAAFLSHDPDGWPSIKAWLNERLATFCSRGTKRDARVVTLEMFRLSLPDEIRSAPRTCFAGDGLHDREAPPARFRSRLWGLSRLFNTASLYALMTAPILRRAAQFEEHMRTLERVEEIMTTFSPDGRWTKEVYRDALHAYAIDRTIRPKDRPAVRDLTVRYWRLIVSRLVAYVRRLPDAVAVELRRHVPPLFRIDLAFRKDLRDRYGDIRAIGRAERKRDSHDALERFDAILAAACNRRDEMRAFGEASRNEQDAFSPDQTHRDFGVIVPILNEQGSLAGGVQMVWFRIWRTDAAWRSLPYDGEEEPTTTRPDPITADEEMPDHWPPFVVEHLRNEPIAGSVTRSPLFVELDRSHVFTPITSVSPALRSARHDMIRDRNLPGFVAMPAGLVSFDIWRARLKRAGLEVGRHFMALEELELGARLGFHALDCVARSFNRAQEVRQQRNSGWKVVDPEDLGFDPAPAEDLTQSGDEGGREKWFTQKTIPKAPRHLDLAQIPSVPLAIPESSLNEAMDIGELQCRLFGWQTLPAIAAAPDLAWKCGPADYVISCSGSHLTDHQVRMLVRYLLTGWPPYTLHDFRHVMAEDAAMDHLHPALIALLLGDRSVEVAAYYAKLPQWARDIVRQAEMQRRMDEQDRRLAKDAAVTSAGIFSDDNGKGA